MYICRCNTECNTRCVPSPPSHLQCARPFLRCVLAVTMVISLLILPRYKYCSLTQNKNGICQHFMEFKLFQNNKNIHQMAPYALIGTVSSHWFCRA